MTRNAWRWHHWRMSLQKWSRAKVICGCFRQTPTRGPFGDRVRRAHKTNSVYREEAHYYRRMTTSRAWYWPGNQEHGLRRRCSGCNTGRENKCTFNHTLQHQQEVAQAIRRSLSPPSGQVWIYHSLSLDFSFCVKKASWSSQHEVDCAGKEHLRSKMRNGQSEMAFQKTNSSIPESKWVKHWYFQMFFTSLPNGNYMVSQSLIFNSLPVLWAEITGGRAWTPQ